MALSAAATMKERRAPFLPVVAFFVVGSTPRIWGGRILCFFSVFFKDIFIELYTTTYKRKTLVVHSVAFYRDTLGCLINIFQFTWLL